MEEADVKADVQKIRRQLKSGYHVIRVQDRRSPYAADLILVKSPPERKRGIVQGVKTYFQSPESLIRAKLNAAMPRERSEKDRDDIRAILANTRVKRHRILEQARKEGTIEIFREILQSTTTRKSEF